jgi:uncharacterized membrane protein
MFSQVHGLPLHPLAVHATVVFVPLASLLGILFVVPRTRAWSRVPFVLVSLGALASVFVARLSGQKFFEALHIDAQSERVQSLIHKHEHRAGYLLLFTAIFAVVAVVAYVASRDAQKFTGALAAGVCAVVAVVAVVVAFQTYLVGDIGSRAVWNPNGTTNFGSSGK